MLSECVFEVVLCAVAWQELEKLNIQMNMSSKQMQEKLLASLDEREEMETRIEDLGQSQHVAKHTAQSPTHYIVACTVVHICTRVCVNRHTCMYMTS